MPDKFGECKSVVEAVVKLARERLITWRGVEHALKELPCFLLSEFAPAVSCVAAKPKNKIEYEDAVCGLVSLKRSQPAN